MNLVGETLCGFEAFMVAHAKMEVSVFAKYRRRSFQCLLAAEVHALRENDDFVFVQLRHEVFSEFLMDMIQVSEIASAVADDWEMFRRIIQLAVFSTIDVIICDDLNILLFEEF